jgi:hypothetical protein
VSDYGELKSVDLAALSAVSTELGDPALLTQLHPAPDLVHWLAWLEGRVSALETAQPIVVEGSLEVDNYANGFIRVRDTGGLLADGQVHSVNMILATTPGPGGVVITEPPGVPASTNPAWFDDGGTLGYVKGATGTNVNQTTLRNWVKYGDPGTANHYVLYVHKTVDPADNTKPLLVVDQVVSVA